MYAKILIALAIIFECSRYQLVYLKKIPHQLITYQNRNKKATSSLTLSSTLPLLQFDYNKCDSFKTDPDHNLKPVKCAGLRLIMMSDVFFPIQYN